MLSAENITAAGLFPQEGCTSERLLSRRYLRQLCEINGSDSDSGSDSTAAPTGPDAASGWCFSGRSSLTSSQPPTPPPLRPPCQLLCPPLSPPSLLPPYLPASPQGLNFLHEAPSDAHVFSALPPCVSPAYHASMALQLLATPPPPSLPPSLPSSVSGGILVTTPPPPTFAPSVLLRSPPGLSGLSLDQQWPSLGSVQHGAGHCRPCAWFWKKPQGCQNSHQCRHCHLCPEGELKTRRRAKLTKFGLLADGDSLFADTLQPSSDDSEPVAATPPLTPQAAPLPHGAAISCGSALHDSGACQPCAWFWKTQGCQNGEDCGRCHQCPAGEVKKRKKMKLAGMRAEKEQVVGELETEVLCENGVGSLTDKKVPFDISTAVQPVFIRPPGFPCSVGDASAVAEFHKARSED